jgi:hypothetical protein
VHSISAILSILLTCPIPEVTDHLCGAVSESDILVIESNHD